MVQLWTRGHILLIGISLWTAVQLWTRGHILLVGISLWTAVQLWTRGHILLAIICRLHGVLFRWGRSERHSPSFAKMLQSGT